MIKDDQVSQLQEHFNYDGDLILKNGNEAAIQDEINDIKQNMINQAKRQQEAEDPGSVVDDIAMIKKTLRNKFNYNDR